MTDRHGGVVGGGGPGAGLQSVMDGVKVLSGGHERQAGQHMGCSLLHHDNLGSDKETGREWWGTHGISHKWRSWCSSGREGQAGQHMRLQLQHLRHLRHNHDQHADGEAWGIARGVFLPSATYKARTLGLSAATSFCCRATPVVVMPTTLARRSVSSE